MRRKSPQRSFLAGLMLLGVLFGSASAEISPQLLKMEQELTRLVAAGRYAEAEKQALRMVEYARREPDVANYSAALIDLIALYSDQGRFPEAESAGREALRLMEQRWGREHWLTADAVNNLGNVCRQMGRYREAEQLHRRAWEVRKSHFGANSQQVAASVENLAIAFDEMGRHAEAEPLFLSALATRTRLLGYEHEEVAKSIYNLGLVYYEQNRLEEAVEHVRESQRLFTKLLGAQHLKTGQALAGLSRVFTEMGQLVEAEQAHDASVAIFRREFGEDHPFVRDQAVMAHIRMRQGRHADAERILRDMLLFHEKYYGSESHKGSVLLGELANAVGNQGRHQEADALFLRATALLERTETQPFQLMVCKDLHAHNSWAAGNRNQAIELIQEAIALAEQQRVHVAGGELQSAQAFLELRRVYMTAADFYRQSGRTLDLFNTLDQARARALFDQIEMAHVDLWKGMPADVAMRLRQSQEDAQVSVLTLEKQMDSIAQRVDLSTDAKQTQLDQLSRKLAAARTQLLATYDQIRTQSPIYRRGLGTEFQPVAVAQLRDWLRGQEAVLLYYAVSETESVAMIVDGEHEQPRVAKLTLNERQRQALGAKGDQVTAACWSPAC